MGLALVMPVGVIAPLLAVIGPVRMPFAILTAVTLLTFLRYAAVHGFTLTSAFLHPGAALPLSYAILRSTVITLRNGGVTWRDTFYPLKELRKHSI